MSISNPQQQLLQQQLLLQMQQGQQTGQVYPKDQLFQQQAVPLTSERKPLVKSPNPQV